jgi:nicotinamide riboside transporter PnuC
MIWSWVLAVIGVAGIFFVGRKTIWGWLVLLFNECLWITYALITDQYGFIFSALAYAVVYIRSYIHWKADENKIPEKTINDLKREREEFYATQTTFE